MAKDKHENEEGVMPAEVGETLGTIEHFFEENQNIVLGVLGAIILVVAALVGYDRFIKAPKEQEAIRQAFKAQEWFEADSFRLALEGDGNYYGFYDIMDEFKSTSVGKTSRYYAGICNLQLGNYDEAISYLGKFKTSDKNVQAVAYGATGDAYAQLGDMESAAQKYKAAAQESDLKLIAPTYYLRAGKAYEVNGDNAAALKMYKEAAEKYPDAANIIDIKKNIARVEGMLE